jgi:hypothetical protein
MYVGITRARYSVAFVFDGAAHAIGAQRWVPLLAWARALSPGAIGDPE